jgi:hypothetical protein
MVKTKVSESLYRQKGQGWSPVGLIFRGRRRIVLIVTLPKVTGMLHRLRKNLRSKIASATESKEGPRKWVGSLRVPLSSHTDFISLDIDKNLGLWVQESQFSNSSHVSEHQPSLQKTSFLVPIRSLRALLTEVGTQPGKPGNSFLPSFLDSAVLFVILDFSFLY